MAITRASAGVGRATARAFCAARAGLALFALVSGYTCCLGALADLLHGLFLLAAALPLLPYGHRR